MRQCPQATRGGHGLQVHNSVNDPMAGPDLEKGWRTGHLLWCHAQGFPPPPAWWPGQITGHRPWTMAAHRTVSGTPRRFSAAPVARGQCRARPEVALRQGGGGSWAAEGGGRWPGGAVSRLPGAGGWLRRGWGEAGRPWSRPGAAAGGVRGSGGHAGHGFRRAGFPAWAREPVRAAGRGGRGRADAGRPAGHAGGDRVLQ
jgi:hypothetical protein